MTEGIYILANDVVYHQVVALLNSIEVNVGKQFPICIVPYDDQLENIRQELKTRDNVTLFDDLEAISRWEDFATQLWQTHPTAMKTWQQQGIKGISRMGLHRRLAIFDGPFDKFIYLDADTLILNSLDVFFQTLNHYDWVVYDFQYLDPTHVYNVNSPRLTEVFPPPRLSSEIFCSGLFASKRGVFDEQRRNWLLSQLQAGEAEVLYMSSHDQTILNYMVMRSEISSCNLSRHLSANEVTGCCVTSPHFQEQDYILYDQGKRLTYLHYIGLSAHFFNSICAGENIDFPYRELFLHYRYLHEPENRPQFTTKPIAYNQPPSLATRLLRKLRLTP